MLLPGIGVMSWKEVEKRVQWGTLLMFGIGISLGSTLLDTQYTGQSVRFSAGPAPAAVPDDMQQ